MSDDLLALDGVAHLDHWDFEWSEVGFISVDLGRVPSELVGSYDCPARSLLQ